MKITAMIILLIYQIALFIMSLILKNDYEKEIRNRISFTLQIIPLAQCIILAM